MDSHIEFFSHRIPSLFGTSPPSSTKSETNSTSEIVQRILSKLPVSHFKSTKKRNVPSSAENGKSVKPARISLIRKQILTSKKAINSKQPKKASSMKKNSSFDKAWDILTKNNVSSLSIKYRSMTSEKLFESFKNLEKLKKVVISNCDLKEEMLPDGLFKNCKELKHLFLTNNKLIKLDTNVFQQLKCVENLNLSNNQLQVLHESTFQNCHLICHLDLSNNHLKCLSENIFNSCKNLKSLNLANNQIEYLERNIFQELENLKDFNIASNGLKSLEAKIFDKCLEISKIDISDNDDMKINDDFITQLENPRRKNPLIFLIPNTKLIIFFQISKTNTQSFNYNANNSEKHLFLHSAFSNKDYNLVNNFFSQILNSHLKRAHLLSFLYQIDSNGQTLFHLASQHGNIEIMKHMLDSNIDLNLVDSSNNAALHLLVLNKKNSALKFLFEYLAKNKKLNKLKFNILNNEGKSALHLASCTCNEQAIGILCDYGCNVDVLDSNKLTALEATLSSTNLDENTKAKIIQALVKCGASYNEDFDVICNFLKDLKIDKREIKNLVFEGGGVKGIAYIGALKRCIEIENFFKFEEIVNIGGTSAGAMHACLLALDYKLEEMEDILRQIDLKNLFLDDDSLKNEFLEIKENFHSNLVVNTFRIGKFLKKISESFGLFPGKVFLDFYEDKVSQKLGKYATFKDLQERIENGEKKFKYLYLVGSNLTTGDSEVFSHIDTPDMIISDAVRISMSIPLIWPPHKYYIRDENNERIVRPDKINVDYVDGGLLNNYPIGIFDRKIITNHSETTYFNFNTLGFRLSKPTTIKKPSESQEDLFFPYLTSLVNFYFKKEEVNHTKRVEDQQRTVYIDTLGLSPLDFNLSRETMDNLIVSGSRAVDEFLSSNNSIDNEEEND